jgi:hypothetical protein
LYLLYGSTAGDIESMRRLLESTLGITFTAHESSTAGLYYLWGRPHGESLVLQFNSDLDDEGPVPLEPEFEAAQLLLYVNCPSDPERIRDALATVADQIWLLQVSEQ